MRWRLSKLNWSYGLGELLIVITGVLIALAVDQWNRDRMDRLEERAIVGRLLSDLNMDLQDIADQLQSIDTKEASLLRVQSVMDLGAIPNEPVGFLRDIVIGANYGWNQFEARRITISELMATGRLSLIRDSALRVQIAEYYEADSGIHQRIDERETEYPHISYRLVGRANEGTLEGDSDAIELDIDSGDAQQIATDVLDSPLNSYVTAELNLARFIRATGIRLQSTAGRLREELQKYYETL